MNIYRIVKKDGTISYFLDDYDDTLMQIYNYWERNKDRIETIKYMGKYENFETFSNEFGDDSVEIHRIEKKTKENEGYNCRLTIKE